jgi:hypothetical protein
MAKVGTKTFVSTKDFSDWIATLSFEAVVLERVNRIELELFQYNSTNMKFTHHDGSESKITAWEKGFAFSSEYEVRWNRNESDEYEVYLITDDDSIILVNFITRNISDFNKRSFSVFLWGTKRVAATIWKEERIPKLLHYPSQVGDSPKLTINEYRKVWWENDCAKEEVFYRFTKLGE